MLVEAVESTPNPSSFLLRLDGTPEGVAATGVRGQTFWGSRAGQTLCPPSLASVLSVEGVESIFACGDMLTVNKVAAAQWSALLPAVIAALGGASEGLVASGLQPGPRDGGSSVSGGVAIRLQMSLKLPIQVEATGWLSTPVRAKLSPRFSSAMAELVGRSGEAAFFEGRRWLDRGWRYPKVTPGVALDEQRPVESERAAVAAALAAELEELEAAYDDEWLSSIVLGRRAKSKEPPAAAAAAAAAGDVSLSLADVDRLCDEDARGEAAGEGGPGEPLLQLAAFAAAGVGSLSARRNAIAYLGGTAGRGGDAAFEAIAAAFTRERAAGLRRTAGDALSDLGDARAVPLAMVALTDSASLVRWRAARILGELGEDAAAVAALKQGSFNERTFEVAFEMKDAARKVAQRTAGSDGAAKGPMWRQIQEGTRLEPNK